MNIKITHSWLLEYIDTKATPEEIQKYLSLCGPSVERVEKIGDNDYSYDIEITSNRIDTASVYGIAREAYAILNRFGIKTIFKPYIPSKSAEPKNSAALPVSITDSSKLCRRLLAVVLDNITLQSSPQYIQDRLNTAGIRSLNNVVDITNYVMTEIGHPTHVFDYDRIKTHKLIIRNAKNNEEIVTLDDKKYKLNADDIIIDDGTGTVIDLPGIMGTANSVVTKDTKRIIFFLESNDPAAIRKSSMRYGIRTVAATINEKSPDPETALHAFQRGVDLYKEITGARVASDITDIYPNPLMKKSVSIDMKDVNRLIGIEIPQSDVVGILKNLGFPMISDKANLMTFEVPLYRYFDVTLKEDLVEEVARIYGYANLPSALQPMVYIKQPKEMELLFKAGKTIAHFLKHIGLHEAVNYSMISKEMIVNCDLDPKNHLVLRNTISEEIKYMRTHLMPSLIRNIKINEGKMDQLRFFEIAKTYKPRPNELPLEEYKVGIVTNTDYMDLKGVVDALLAELNIDNFKITKSEHPMLSQNNQGKITIGKTWVGEFGQLKSVYQMKNGIQNPVFLAVFDLYSLITHYTHIRKQYVPINAYATIKLDLTLKQNPNLSYQKIKEQAFKSSTLLTDMEMISLYQKNLTIRFYFSNKEKNLTEEEAKNELKNIVTHIS